jgi:hypothetical protein
LSPSPSSVETAAALNTNLISIKEEDLYHSSPPSVLVYKLTSFFLFKNVCVTCGTCACLCFRIFIQKTLKTIFFCLQCFLYKYLKIRNERVL